MTVRRPRKAAGFMAGTLSLAGAGEDLGARVTGGALGLEAARRLLALDEGIARRGAVGRDHARVEARARRDLVARGGQVLLRVGGPAERRAHRRAREAVHLAADHLW